MNHAFKPFAIYTGKVVWATLVATLTLCLLITRFASKFFDEFIKERVTSIAKTVSEEIRNTIKESVTSCHISPELTLEEINAIMKQQEEKSLDETMSDFVEMYIDLMTLKATCK